MEVVQDFDKLINELAFERVGKGTKNSLFEHPPFANTPCPTAPLQDVQSWRLPHWGWVQRSGSNQHGLSCRNTWKGASSPLPRCSCPQSPFLSSPLPVPPSSPPLPPRAETTHCPPRGRTASSYSLHISTRVPTAAPQTSPPIVFEASLGAYGPFPHVRGKAKRCKGGQEKESTR